MKFFIRTFFQATAVASGFFVAKKTVDALSDPVKRKQLKNKIIERLS